MFARSRSIARVALPLKLFAQRFSFLLLILASAALMLLGRIDPTAFDTVRARVVDAFSPIMDTLSRPAAATAHVVETLRELATLREQNAQLREENARLLKWQQVALRMEAENESLRALANLPDMDGARYVTGRIVGDQGGPFVKSVILDVGVSDGVAKGHPVLGAVEGQGLVGRVQGVGGRSARVLLITDMNSRVPVVLERTRQRAILGGDNTDMPRLLYLPTEMTVEVGERVVTSGHGGVFPPGIPVGVVTSVADGMVRVAPLVDLGRLDHVRVLQYNPDDLAPEKEARHAEVAATTP